ncbi:hypothetical protein, partial [Photobacterium lipolyticum]|uniref:hypothetical protein n=1 Tax=Photobacterium lipolyticum TaxID=266810 RepID=UPI001FE71B71
ARSIPIILCLTMVLSFSISDSRNNTILAHYDAVWEREETISSLQSELVNAPTNAKVQIGIYQVNHFQRLQEQTEFLFLVPLALVGE